VGNTGQQDSVESRLCKASFKISGIVSHLVCRNNYSVYSSHRLLLAAPSSTSPSSTSHSSTSHSSTSALYFSQLYFSQLYFPQLYFSRLYISQLYFSQLYFSQLYFSRLYFSRLYLSLIYFPLKRPYILFTQPLSLLSFAESPSALGNT
jgi:hypothetical protein